MGGTAPATRWHRVATHAAEVARVAQELAGHVRTWLERAADHVLDRLQPPEPGLAYKGGGQGHVSAGLAALRAAAGRQAKELDQDEVKRRLARIAGQELGEEHDHASGQGDRDIRGRLADVLSKARAEEQEREKARMREREQELDEERRRQREIDRDLGWEL